MSQENSQTLDFLESSLKTQLDAEEERIKKKVKFLRRVYDSTSNGTTLELASTELSDAYLIGSIDSLFGS